MRLVSVDRTKMGPKLSVHNFHVPSRDVSCNMIPSQWLPESKIRDKRCVEGRSSNSGYEPWFRVLLVYDGTLSIILGRLRSGSKAVLERVVAVAVPGGGRAAGSMKAR